MHRQSITRLQLVGCCYLRKTLQYPDRTQLQFRFQLKRFSSDKKLTRTERRLLERKQRNKDRREKSRSIQATENDKNKVIAPISKIGERLRRLFHPRVVGSGAYFQWDHLISLGYRLPFFLAMAFVLTNEDLSPYVVQASLGPSMLPTIQFIGDLWLVETGAWYRMLGWTPSYQRGQVILWKDPLNARVSCKRIIGLPGDKVKRYGEYAEMYKQRDDWAVVWPNDAEARGLDNECPWDTERTRDIRRTIEVPDGHVWLEGDCPPFSLDSRHYGPIPMDWIRGRLLLRVWPLSLEDEYGKSIPSRLPSIRPRPFPSLEDYLGKRYNFYRVPKQPTPRDATEQ